MNNSKTKDELVSICKEQHMRRYTGKKTDYAIRNIKENIPKYETIQDKYKVLLKEHKSNL